MVTLGENCFVRDCDVFIVTFRDGTLEPIYDVFDAKKMEHRISVLHYLKIQAFQDKQNIYSLKILRS